MVSSISGMRYKEGAARAPDSRIMNMPKVIQIFVMETKKIQEENIISCSATSHCLGNNVFVITDKILTMTRDMIYR